LAHLRLLYQIILDALEGVAVIGNIKAGSHSVAMFLAHGADFIVNGD